MSGKPVKTETTVKSYNAEGELVYDVTTTVVVATPPAAEPEWGGYL